MALSPYLPLRVSIEVHKVYKAGRLLSNGKKTRPRRYTGMLGCAHDDTAPLHLYICGDPRRRSRDLGPPRRGRFAPGAAHRPGILEAQLGLLRARRLLPARQPAVERNLDAARH